MNSFDSKEQEKAPRTNKQKTKFNHIQSAAFTNEYALPFYVRHRLSRDERTDHF